MKRALATALLIATVVTAPAFAVKGRHAGIIDIFSGPTASQTCALLADARVLCWGNGVATAAPLGIGLDVAEVSLGEAFGCARVSDGRVFCWGSNDAGQLGTVGAHGDPEPVRYSGSDFGNVTAIAAGQSHVCALRGDTSVWCWGSNAFGQLGNFMVGIGAKFNTPIQVVVHDEVSNPQLANATKITAGYGFSCALLADDTGACWGNDNEGELGNDNVSKIFNSPQTVKILVGVDLQTLVMSGGSLASAGYHSCGLIADDIVDSVRCWGLNDYGELSDGTNSDGLTASISQAIDPTTGVTGKITNAIAVAGGEYFTCMILVDLSVRCSGSNAHDQIANPTVPFGAKQLTGIAALQDADKPLSGIVKLVAGRRHACTLDVRNAIYCWGDNSVYQLGATSPSQTNAPMAVSIDTTMFTDDFDGD